MSYQVRQGGPQYPWNYQLNVSSIVSFDSVKRFVETSEKVKWTTNYEMGPHHIVHIENGTTEDIQRSIQDGFSIDSVAYLIKENDSCISLVSSFMFSENNCRVNQLLKINRFTRKMGRWENTNFYPDKYRNFYNCSLNVLNIKSLNKPHLRTSGSSVEIKAISALAKSLNFTLNTVTSIDPSNQISSIDFFAMALNFKTENQIIDAIKLSIEFYREKQIFVVPPGEPYSDLEKMFMMFDKEVWIAICVTLTTGFLSIQVINCMAAEIQSFFYGQNIGAPTLSMVEIFLNGGAVHFPTRNFARFILLMFVIWSLIIRTCYQSMLFECLQKDLRKPSIEVVDDLIAKNFTFHDCRLTSEPLSFKQKENFYVNQSQCLRNITKILDIVAEPANKAVIMTTAETLQSAKNLIYRSGSSSLSMNKATISEAPVGISVMRLSSYYEVFSGKVLRLQASGLIDYWAKNNMNPKGFKQVQEGIGPQVLTMEHIGIGFIVCLAPLLLIFVI